MSQLKRRPADEAALVVQLHLIRRRAKAPAADKHLRLLGRKLGNKQTNKKKTNTELVEPADRVRLLFFFFATRSGRLPIDWRRWNDISWPSRSKKKVGKKNKRATTTWGLGIKASRRPNDFYLKPIKGHGG